MVVALETRLFHLYRRRFVSTVVGSEFEGDAFCFAFCFTKTKRDPTNNLSIDGLECSFLLSLARYGCPPFSTGRDDSCFLSSREKREREGESSLLHFPRRGKSDDEYETTRVSYDTHHRHSIVFRLEIVATTRERGRNWKINDSLSPLV